MRKDDECQVEGGREERQAYPGFLEGWFIKIQRRVRERAPSMSLHRMWVSQISVRVCVRSRSLVRGHASPNNSHGVTHNTHTHTYTHTHTHPAQDVGLTKWSKSAQVEAWFEHIFERKNVIENVQGPRTITAAQAYHLT